MRFTAAHYARERARERSRESPRIVIDIGSRARYRARSSPESRAAILDANCAIAQIAAHD